MAEHSQTAQFLAQHGVRPTSGRILVARALAEAGRPLTMSEIEERLVTVDKSGIFRALSLFREKHIVHVIDADGTRYELCHAEDAADDTDHHVHFYCSRCHRTTCLPDVPLPDVRLPEGFEAEGGTYVVKGCCPSCARRG